jgi:alkylglycerol monooxygenase
LAAKVILFASPIFFLLIALEFFWGLKKGRNTYRLNDAINSLSLGILSQITAIFGRGLRIGAYALFYYWVQPLTGTLKDFWTSPVGWLVALIFYDFCYYWLHRLGHETAILWAAHVVHHQSQEYNLSTALRQTSTGFLLGWIFYIPMALAGVPPEVFAVVGLIDLLYQFWVHTEHIDKLGWFDRVFCSPSNHRVHHAINDRYLDRNYGGILVVWDRLFGTFKEEDERCVYGTRSPLNSWDPIWANLEVYASLARATWRTRRWQDKFLVWIKPPGWLPADLKANLQAPLPAQKTTAPTPKIARFDPLLSTAQARIALLWFVTVLLGATVFLDQAKKVPFMQAGLACVVLSALLWALGRYLQAFKNSSLPPNQ